MKVKGKKIIFVAILVCMLLAIGTVSSNTDSMMLYMEVENGTNYIS